MTKHSENTETSNSTKPVLPTVLDYAKEKLIITQKMMDEDEGLDYNHSSFLSGLLNAYEDIVYALEKDVVKHCR